MTARAALLGSRTFEVLTLSGEVLSVSEIGVNATAQFFVNTDGTVDRRTNLGAFVQIDAATDWIIPNDFAPDDYECRYTNLTGDALSAPTSAAEDVWRALSLGNFSFTQFDSDPAAGGKSSTFDIQLRKGAGPVLKTGSYTLSATRDDT